MWVNVDDFDAFEAAVAEDPSVNEFSALAENDRERFYQMQWVTDIKDVFDASFRSITSWNRRRHGTRLGFDVFSQRRRLFWGFGGFVR